MWSAPPRNGRAPPRWPRNCRAPGKKISRRGLKGRQMSDTAEILEQAARWREAGKGVALATVVSTWGSSPRPLGSKLAVDGEGAFIGSVSGGCVEGAVVTEALEAIHDGTRR